MNKRNLQEIFDHYIDRFEFLNEEPQIEYYKWQICEQYPKLLKGAFASEDDAFAKALYEVKKCTHNIIDSYTQPFNGLVEFAKREPGSVRKLLLDLYADDGRDLKVQMEKIADFFVRSNELLDRYFPGSFLYKPNSHSVSALLFLNDPEHHYMYKATQSQRFADCVEFYDDWGTGDNIRLDIYYRMCDELVAAIKDCPALMETDRSRFDGRLKLSGGGLHPDLQKHILAFDLIYCCTAYDLFDGITYTKRNIKEKQLYLAEKQKAESLWQSFEKASRDAEALREALKYFVEIFAPGVKIQHKKYGEGRVDSVSESYVEASFPEKQVQISLPVGIANRIISVEHNDFEKLADKYREVLKRYDTIPKALEYASRALEPYEEYLDEKPM